MVPRTVLHSKRWLASAAAGALLAGAAVSAQTPANPATSPTTASATSEPRPLGSTAARPVQPRPHQSAQPAPQKGGLLSFLFGSNGQQRKQPTRPSAAQPRPGQPASHPVPAGPTGTTGPVAPPANIQPHVQADLKTSDVRGKSHAVPAAHTDSPAVDSMAPPKSFAPPSFPQASPARPKQPGFLGRLFGRRPEPTYQYAVPQSRSSSTSPAPAAAAEPSMVESRYPTARRLDGHGGVTSSVIPHGEIDEATTSVLPAPNPLDNEQEMFVGVPPAPLPADAPPAESLPVLPAAGEAELPQFAQEAPALLPAPESLPIPAEASELAAPAPQITATSNATADGVELPKITPAGGTESEAAPASESDVDLQEKFARIAARNGTGFKGFCPVTLRDERDLADSDSKFTSSYHWQEYQFCSAAAKAKFDANPEKYVPVLGGDDVVRTADGDHVAGSIEFAAWYKNRLYLFNSKESMRTFVTEPARFARDE